MSNSIYTPYCYLIGWSKLNKFYYGVRTAKNCNPNDFWVKYFTSSKEVKKFKKENGDPDIIQIRKTFKNKEDAMKWEEKILRRMCVKKRTDFLNLCETYSDFNTTGYTQVKNLKTNKMEYVSCEEYRNNKTLYEHHASGHIMSDEHKKILSNTNSGNGNPMYGKRGSDHPAYGFRFTEEQKQKMSANTSGKNNHFYGKSHTNETKKKLSMANSGINSPRYGKLNVINTITNNIETITVEEYNKQKEIKDRLYIHINYGKKMSEEQKQKIIDTKRHNKKPSHVKGGENHPCYGRIWIHNSEKCLKIFPEELENYIELGYEIGRPHLSDDRKKIQSQISKNKIWIVNPNNETKFIPSNEFENYSNQGFIKGRKYVN